MKHEDLTRETIGAAMEVLNHIKPGQNEKIYERAMLIELESRGLKVTKQKQFAVSYKGHPVGTFIPDLLVNESLIVDPKVVSSFTNEHYAQMLGYLNICDLEVGLLLNFKHAKLEWKRIIRDRPSPETQPSV